MSSSLTTEVYGRPANPTHYRVYYILQNSADLERALTSHHPVVLMFSASWSEPSKAMKSVFRKVALDNRSRAVFCFIDVDKFKGLAEQYGAEALPTFVVIKNREVKGKVAGIKAQELKRTVETNL